MTTDSDAVPFGEHAFRRLLRANVAMGGLHFMQAVAVLVLATDFTLPVVASFLTGPPGSASSPSVLFEVSIAWGVAVFLFLSAAFHWMIATVWRERYRGQLSRGQNQLRWLEYSLSASVMIVLIAMITGISDVAALVALFGVSAGMIFFGAVQERYERPGGSLWPFWLGSLLGVVPWIAIGIYLVAPGSAASPPGFVYGIFFSLFAFFNSFALVQWLQYRGRGRWADYLVGERAYIVLSLAAKSALAWQVFAGTLVP